MPNRPRKIILGVSLLTVGFLAGHLAWPKEPAATLPAFTTANRVYHCKVAVPIAPVPTLPVAIRLIPAREGMESQLRLAIINLSSEARFDDLIQRLVDWAKSDPAAALDFARAHFTNERQSQVLTRVLAELAKAEPQAAWNWTFQNLPTDFQQINTVLTEIAKNDSKTAWTYATQYAERFPAEANNAYVGALCGMTYAGDYETAANFIRDAGLASSTNGNCDFPALVAGQWAHFEPDKAAEWVESLPDGQVRSTALLQIGGAWAQNDPRAAANFAVSLPAGDTRKQVLTQAILGWVDQDPAAVADWINSQGANPDFDQVIMAVATTPKADTETAIAWAGMISQPELQVQALSHIVWTWMNQDPKATMNYLQNTAGLPPGIAEQVRQRINLENHQ